jgi:cytochrome o ubiquinol oxidase subunit I
MFGKLSWNAIPWDQPIPLAAGATVLFVFIAVIVWVAAKGYVPYLWREWITRGSASWTPHSGSS